MHGMYENMWIKPWRGNALMNLIEFKHKDKLEEGVSGTPRWCLCVRDGGDFRQIHTPAVCKDYAHEILVANKRPDLLDELFPVFGMEYKGEKMEEGRLIFSYVGKKKSQFDNLLSNVNLLKQFHDMIGVESDLMIHQLDECCFVIEADRYWQSSPLHISLFLIFVRALTHKESIECIEDALLLENTRKLFMLPWSIPRLLAEFDKAMCGWWEDVSFDCNETLHHYGPVSFVDTLIQGSGLQRYVNPCPYGSVKKYVETANTKLVFVYGTLKQGQGNHHVLGDRMIPVVGPAGFRLEYKMISLGGFPGLIKDTNLNRIQGEVYLIDSDTEKHLDILEGYPSFYQKDIIRTNFNPKIEAMVYTLDASYLDGHDVIDSGEWR